VVPGPPRRAGPGAAPGLVARRGRALVRPPLRHRQPDGADAAPVAAAAGPVLGRRRFGLHRVAAAAAHAGGPPPRPRPGPPGVLRRAAGLSPGPRADS